MSDPWKRDRRLGVWSIATEMLKGAALDAVLLLVQRDVVILNARDDFMYDRRRFLGRGPMFKIVPPGVELPEYRVVVHTEHNRPVRIEWVKADGVFRPGAVDAMSEWRA